MGIDHPKIECPNPRFGFSIRGTQKIPCSKTPKVQKCTAGYDFDLCVDKFDQKTKALDFDQVVIENHKLGFRCSKIGCLIFRNGGSGPYALVPTLFSFFLLILRRGRVAGYLSSLAGAALIVPRAGLAKQGPPHAGVEGVHEVTFFLFLAATRCQQG